MLRDGRLYLSLACSVYRICCFSFFLLVWNHTRIFIHHLPQTTTRTEYIFVNVLNPRGGGESYRRSAWWRAGMWPLVGIAALLRNADVAVASSGVVIRSFHCRLPRWSQALHENTDFHYISLQSLDLCSDWRIISIVWPHSNAVLSSRPFSGTEGVTPSFSPVTCALGIADRKWLCFS